MKFTIEKLEEIGSRISDKEINNVIQILDVKEGQRLMDLGAGSGKYTLEFAKKVGMEGLVFAVDQETFICDHIIQKAKQAQLSNVKGITSATPNYDIENESLDCIFTRNVYHHLSERENFLKALKHYLKPTGQLVIIDHKKGAVIPGHNPDEFPSVEEVIQLGLACDYHSYKQHSIHKDKICIQLFNQ